MINELKRYRRMKSTGVEWLGDVPEHWDVKRLGNLLHERNEFNDELQVADVLSVLRGRGVIPYAEKGNIGNKKSDDITRYKIVRPNDIVVNCMNVIIGSVGLSKYTGCLSPVYYVLTQRQSEDIPAYLNACFQTKAFQQSLVRIGNGILAHRMRIPMELLKCELLPRPPASEQAAIVRFLDYTDRRIRRYIAAKQKLIKLLEEQKQAIIHRAVTRGLDPNVRLKPSGVQWLGDVPEHWEVVRLGRLIELVTGFPFKSEGFTQTSEDIRLLRGVNISPGKIRWTDVVRWPHSEQENHSAFKLHAGDIVLGMDRPIIQSGTRVATISESDIPALLLQRVARIRPTRELGSRFLTLLLAGKAFANYLTPIFTGISVPHLSPEQIRSFRFALPPHGEQAEIVEWTEENTRKATTAVLNAEREIDLLREYRTRLVADVVTGKLDVREAAERLPDEAEELEAIDDTELLDASADDDPELIEELVDAE